MKLCINCKHCTDGKAWQYFGGSYMTKYCTVPTNPVNGEHYKIKCSTMRYAGFKCGPNGRLYEAKSDTDRSSDNGPTP